MVAWVLICSHFFESNFHLAGRNKVQYSSQLKAVLVAKFQVTVKNLRARLKNILKSVARDLLDEKWSLG